MTAMFALTSILELLFIAGLLIGFWHKDKIIALEDKWAEKLAQEARRLIKRRDKKKPAPVRTHRRRKRKDITPLV